MKSNNKLMTVDEKSDLKVRSKFFQTKNSLLTDLSEDKDKSAVVNLFMGLILAYFGHIAYGDIFYSKGTGFGSRFVMSCFPNFGVLVVSWTFVFLCSVIVYFIFQVWGRLRICLTPKSMKILDTSSFIGFACFWIGVLIFSSYITLTGRTSFLSSVVLLTETFRIFAKSYAFVRDSTPKILQNKIKSEGQPYFPTFSNFLYFMFLPTLIYNDSYHRVRTPVRWNFIAQWSIHILLGIIFFGCIFENAILPELNSYEKFHLFDVIACSFKFHFVTTVFIILIFYIVLHCVQNIFAELLGFPYRYFYSNWWTSINYEDFFYKWNTLVRDWFYVYVYLEVYKNLTNNNKVLAKYSVFFASALFHEIVTSFTVGYFIPVLFIEYFVLVAVVPLIKINDHFWANIFFWFSVSMGIAFCGFFHMLEYFARIKCPIENPTISSYFVPRMLLCYR